MIQGVASSVVLIMWIIYSLLFLVIYHKIFSVLYFNLFNGILREFIIAVFTGAIMTGATLWFWQIAVVIILVIGFLAANSAGNPLGKIPVIIIFVILAGVVGVMGYKVKSAGTKAQNNKGTVQYQENVDAVKDTLEDSYNDNEDAGDSNMDLYNESDRSDVVVNDTSEVPDNTSETPTPNEVPDNNIISSDFDPQWYYYYPTYVHENGEHILTIATEGDGYIYVIADGNILTYTSDTAGEEMGHERYTYTCDDGSLLTVCYGDGYNIYLESPNDGEVQGLYYPTESNNSVDEQGDYIIEGSDSRYLSEGEVAALSPEEIGLAKNEIYARHGRIFDSEDLKEYFESQSWYHGEIEPEDFDESVLNDYERANIDLLVSYE